MKFITEQGEPIEGATPQDVVIALRNGGRFTNGQGLEEYMQGFSERRKEWDNSEIRYDNPTVFVQDLERIGYLKSVE